MNKRVTVGQLRKALECFSDDFYIQVDVLGAFAGGHVKSIEPPSIDIPSIDVTNSIGGIVLCVTKSRDE